VRFFRANKVTTNNVGIAAGKWWVEEGECVGSRSLLPVYKFLTVQG